MRTSARLFASALFVALSLLMVPAAQAHTAVVTTTPPAGSSMATVPTQVTIETDDGVQEMGTTISVLSPSGERVDDGTVEIDGKTVLTGLRALSEAGTYTVNYRLLARDGHALEGSYAFTLTTTPSQSPSPTPSETVDTPKPTSSNPWPTVAVALIALSALALLIRRFRK